MSCASWRGDVTGGRPAVTAAPAGRWWAAPAAVVAGAVLLAWPALLNGYPLVFSDTGGFLHQTTGPLMLWDKPWIYGPFLHLFHWRTTLWLPLAAQALVVSHLLWVTQSVLRGGATPGAHVAACTVAAALTAAPFTVALLMPDVFAPVVLLALLLLGLGGGGLTRGEAAWLGGIAALGIAAHPAHLPLALAAIGMVLVTGRWRGAVRAALPLAAAVALVLATNAVGHGRAALSPHGATFLLARLQADGPATEVIRAQCPAAGWYLCAFADRFPMDSQTFLWSPESPVNRDAAGQARFLGGAMISREAAEIVAETLRTYSADVAGAILRNTLAQIATISIGDTLTSHNLATALRPRIAEAFPGMELAAFDDALQARDALLPAVAWVVPAHLVTLILALPLLAVGALRGSDPLRRWFALALLAGLVANAVATGGLSGVFPRYQARIAWLLPVVAMLLLLPPRRRSA